MLLKDIPCEVIEIENPVVTHFAWQPRGHMFTVCHAASDRVGDKPNIGFYQVKKKRTICLYTLTDRQCDTVSWSPSDHMACLASMQHGRMEFFDVKKKAAVAETDHFKMTSIQWDPSGRYLLSISAQPLGDASWAYAAENGYKIWTFQGEPMVSVAKETLYQVMWRPRPRTLLTPAKMAHIKKNLKKTYWEQFEAEAIKIRESTSSAAIQEQVALRDDWKKYRKQCDQEYADESELRKDLRVGNQYSDNEDDYEVVETVIQTLISIDEEPIL